MNFQLENKNVYASDAGQGIDQNKETIVFLHGSGLSHIVWSLTEQFFSNNNFNVLSIDLPGHGNSDGPCLDSIEKIADWLEQVFNKLNLNNLILIGHSQGCLEILDYAHKYPSMFIFGSLDKMVNLEAGKKFSSLINNSSTHIIEGCGHMIMIEKAFEMRDKVLEFLKK